MRWQWSLMWFDPLTPQWPDTWERGGWRQCLAAYRVAKSRAGTSFLAFRARERGEAVSLDTLREREIEAQGR